MKKPQLNIWKTPQILKIFEEQKSYCKGISSFLDRGKMRDYKKERKSFWSMCDIYIWQKEKMGRAAVAYLIPHWKTS